MDDRHWDMITELRDMVRDMEARIHAQDAEILQLKADLKKAAHPAATSGADIMDDFLARMLQDMMDEDHRAQQVSDNAAQ